MISPVASIVLLPRVADTLIIVITWASSLTAMDNEAPDTVSYTHLTLPTTPYV